MAHTCLFLSHYVNTNLSKSNIKKMQKAIHINADPTVSQQTLKSIHIDSLKCLKNLDMEFDPCMTAIMAPNGYGKSSILHALFCSYNIPDTDTSYNYFYKFFRHSNFNTWNGTKFSIEYSYSKNAVVQAPATKVFEKTVERWCDYTTRPLRNVIFIGINTCVPSIEFYSSNKGDSFTKTPLNDAIHNKVRAASSRVMNRPYQEYSEHKAKKKKLIGVKDAAAVEYNSMSMGAGEQRIFYVLNEIITAPKYSLVLIDEIDLLLHTDALLRFLDEIHTVAEHNKLQVIFTTHADAVLKKDYIAVKHLYQTPEQTLCFEKSYPDFIYRLTGASSTEYEIFVEDDVAYAIAEQVCLDNRIKKYVDIKTFGTGDIGIRSACGFVVNEEDRLDKVLFVTDGDKNYYTDDHQSQLVDSFFHGDDPALEDKRNKAKGIISKLVMPDNEIAPEKYYRDSILSLDTETLQGEELELYNLLNEVVVPANTHDYFNIVIDRLGSSRPVVLSRLVSLLKKSANWPIIVGNVQSWIDGFKDNLVH